MKIKRLISILIVITLILALSACQTNTTSSTSTGSATTTTGSATTKTQSSQTTAVTSSDEPIELLWMGFSFTTEIEEDLLMPIIEEKFNVEITRTPTVWNNQESLALYFAEGNRPDVLMCRPIPKATLIKEGFIRSFALDDYYQYMPDHSKSIEVLVPREEVELQMVSDGVAWGIPWATEGYVAPFGDIYNMTWLNKLGISEIPQTIDEMYAYCKAVTQNDPDGNGVDDTFGLSSGGTYGFFSIFAHFEVQHNSYANNNGVITANVIEEGYKEALRLLASWYDEGLIDPEFATKGWMDYQKLAYSGKLGIYSHRVPYNYGSDIPALLSYNSDYKYESTVGLVNSSGKVSTWRDYPNLFAYFPFYFGENCSDEQMHAAMKILNSNAVDEEMALYAFSGVQIGDKPNYQINDGAHVLTEAYLASGTKEFDRSGRAYYGMIPSMLTPISQMSEKSQSLTEYAFSLPFISRGVGFSFEGTSEVAIAKAADVNGISDSYMIDVIMGRKNIDETWDAYVTEWKAAGGQEIIEDYTKRVNK